MKKRTGLWLLLPALAVLISAIVTWNWLIYSESGARWLINRLNAAIDGSVVASEISGDLVVYRWEPVRENPDILWASYRGNERRTGSEFVSVFAPKGPRVIETSLGNPHADSTAFRVSLSNPNQRDIEVRL